MKRILGIDQGLAIFLNKAQPLNLAQYAKFGGNDDILTRNSFLKLAKERIDQLDVPSAIEDIIHFVRDQEAIKKTWSKDFFHYWIDKIQTIP